MKTLNLFSRFSHAKKQPLPESIVQESNVGGENLSYPQQVVLVMQVLENIKMQLSVLPASPKFIEPALEVEAFRQSLQILITQKNSNEIGVRQNAVDQKLQILLQSMSEIFRGCPDALPQPLTESLAALERFRSQLSFAICNLLEQLNDNKEVRADNIALMSRLKSG